jgi:hypothetical protein
MNKERCECHECTQARYVTSFAYLLKQSADVQQQMALKEITQAQSIYKDIK